MYLRNFVYFMGSILTTLIFAGDKDFQVINCPEAVKNSFYDVSKGAGPGGKYRMKPRLSVRCTEDEIIIDANAIPTFTMNNTTPNPLRPVRLHHKIPLNPKLAETVTPIANEKGEALLGDLGVTVTGIPIYGPTEATKPADEIYGSAVYNCLLAMKDDSLCAPGKTTKRGCGAHTGPQAYHYHYIEESCFQGERSLIAKPWELEVDEKKASGIVGYALDGFPIYGMYEHRGGDLQKPVIKLQSSYEKISGKSQETYAFLAFKYEEKQDKELYMDECNGHTHMVDGKLQYHYHATEGFPYIIGCFKGTPQGIKSIGGHHGWGRIMGKGGKGWLGSLWTNMGQATAQGCH